MATAILHNLVVLSAAFGKFVPHGTPGAMTTCSVEELVAFQFPTNTTHVINLKVKSETTGQIGTFELNNILMGASVSKPDRTGLSQWDLITMALKKAGIGWKITGILGLFTDEMKFKATDGSMAKDDMGYKRVKFLDQKDLAIDLHSGHVDEQVFGQKFTYLKGLSPEVAETVHRDMNSYCFIRERKESGKPTRKTRSQNASGAGI